MAIKALTGNILTPKTLFLDLSFSHIRFPVIFFHFWPCQSFPKPLLTVVYFSLTKNTLPLPRKPHFLWRHKCSVLLTLCGPKDFFHFCKNCHFFRFRPIFSVFSPFFSVFFPLLPYLLPVNPLQPKGFLFFFAKKSFFSVFFFFLFTFLCFSSLILQLRSGHNRCCLPLCCGIQRFLAWTLICMFQGQTLWDQIQIFTKKGCKIMIFDHPDPNPNSENLSH